MQGPPGSRDFGGVCSAWQSMPGRRPQEAHQGHMSLRDGRAAFDRCAEVNPRPSGSGPHPASLNLRGLAIWGAAEAPTLYTVNLSTVPVSKHSVPVGEDKDEMV